MKINLNQVDQSQFYVNEHIINGERVCLIHPRHIGVNWNLENLCFRSSVWNDDGELISIGFLKFFNLGERADLTPPPNNLKNATVVTKIDGSLLSITKYKGNFIIRTRGTLDVSSLTNGHEISILKEKYPKLFELCSDDTWPFSIILEWVSPNNQIVIRYDDVDFILIGKICHCDCKLELQSKLDSLAIKLNMKRPERFSFQSVEDLIGRVEQWRDKEGVVLYYNNDQNLLKIKSTHYLFLHHMKSELSSLEKVLDVWLEQGMPDYMTFYNYISTTFDYELAEQCRGHISNICDGYKEVLKIIAGMDNFVKTELVKYPTRRLQAVVTFQSYGKNTNRSSFVFKLLDGKTLGKDDIKKLMFQVLKK